MIKANKKNGFTLIEILIVICLMVIVLTIVSYLFIYTLRVYTRGKNLALIKEKINFISNIIFGDLRSASKILTLGKNPGDQLYSGGAGSQTITFVKYDSLLQKEETVTYALTPTQDPSKYGYNLTRTDSTGESLIDTGLQDLRFKYLSAFPPPVGTENNFGGGLIECNIKMLNNYGLKDEYCQNKLNISLGSNAGLTVYSTTIKSKEYYNYMSKLIFK